MLNQEAYTARNEHLFTSLTGGERPLLLVAVPTSSIPEGG